MKVTLSSTALDIPDSEVEKLIQQYQKKDKKQQFTPGYMNSYFFITNWGDVRYTINLNLDEDKSRLSIGNIFKTEEEAEQKVKYLKALANIKKDTPKWDYKPRGLYYVVYYNIITERLLCSLAANIVAASDPVKFETRHDADESIEKHEDDWKIVLGVE